MTSYAWHFGWTPTRDLTYFYSVTSVWLLEWGHFKKNPPIRMLLEKKRIVIFFFEIWIFAVRTEIWSVHNTGESIKFMYSCSHVKQTLACLYKKRYFCTVLSLYSDWLVSSRWPGSNSHTLLTLHTSTLSKFHFHWCEFNFHNHTFFRNQPNA